MYLPEPSNIVDKYAVSWQRDGEVVVHLKKVKIFLFFFGADKNNNCTVVVTGKADKHRKGEGMLVPCTLHIKGHHKNFLTF